MADATSSTLLANVRQWLLGLIRKRPGLLGFSTLAVTMRFGCSCDDATNAMLELAAEGLVQIRGHIDCPNCDQSLAIDGATVPELKVSGLAMVGRPCSDCNCVIVDAPNVHLSFMVTPAARRAASTGDSQPAEPAGGGE
jgi:hypothetical protein